MTNVRRASEQSKHGCASPAAAQRKPIGGEGNRERRKRLSIFTLIIETREINDVSIASGIAGASASRHVAANETSREIIAGVASRTRLAPAVAKP